MYFIKKHFLLIVLLFQAIGVFGQELKVENPVRFLALGDSYTIGQGVQSNERWPEQLVVELENAGMQIDKLDIIAQTGWTTKNLLNAISDKNPDTDYSLVSLLIGVNNQYQGLSIDIYPGEFRRLLELAIAFCGGRRSGVFVLSIPDYGYTPFGLYNQTNISAEIDAYNTINEALASEMGVTYFNITPISREAVMKPELLAPDNLHPSGEMYARWVELIVSELNLTNFSTHIFQPDEKDNVTVFPNPASDYIVVSAPQHAKIEFFDARGLRIYQMDIIENPNLMIDISTWDKGIYFYMLSSQNTNQLTGKIMVE